MNTHALAITGKQRPHPVAPVSLDDFRYQEGDEVDPAIVAQESNISLYCVDHPQRRAIFVETPPDLDLAAAPFLYQTQYDAAQRLIAVPYDVLDRIVDEVHIDARQLIPVYSTGRCGSTLVSHALNQARGVVGFSEPDVYTQLSLLREPDGSNDADIRGLLGSCTTILCASLRARGASTYALKFRSWGVNLGDLFQSVFPAANVIFLYRNAVGYARSMARLMQGPGDPDDEAERSERADDTDEEVERRKLADMFTRLVPAVGRYTEKNATPPEMVAYITCMWVSVMERCLELHGRGMPMFAARYETLNAAPHAVFDALFAYCGISAPDPTMLDRILAQDSQAGTRLSRVEQARLELSDADVTELKHVLKELSPELTADFIVPGTFVA